MARSCRKWPELSPLVHNRCLVRLKKVTWPLANVCCKASLLTKPCNQDHTGKDMLDDHRYQAICLGPVEVACIKLH